MEKFDVFFSVIIPVYNRAGYILKAIESIQQQTFSNWELIIINDASTDNTKQILDTLLHEKIRIVHNEKNLERCASRNLGIEMAQGKFIAFLDSDDYHLPTHLERMHHFIESKNFEIGLYFSNAYNESIDGKRSDRLCPKFTDYNPYHYFLTYTVNPQRWVVHRDVFQKIKFDENVTICEDMDTSLRIIAAGFPCYQLEERSTVYVAAPDSFTHGDIRKAEKELYFLKKIFSKKELNRKLPLIPRWKLLSMCYFHLAMSAYTKGEKIKFLAHAFRSFFLYPKGYNGKTNKILLVSILYSIPLLSWVLKYIVRTFK